MKAGIIGLGAMGLGMARNLCKQGFLSAVYNRTPGKATEWEGIVHASPQTLAEQVDVVFICVSADQDVLDIVSTIATTVRPGTIVVDMSTVSSSTARQAAILLQDRHTEFLDAPVSGGVEGAAQGTLSMMVGGKTEVLERVRPMLAAMASRIEHMGAVGQGQACKAANQIMAAGINQAVTSALAFAAAQGLEMDKVIEVLAGGAAGNWFLEHRGKTMTRNIFKPGFKVALHHKDLLICQEMAQQSQVVCPLIDATLLDYAELMAQGFGDEDISALFRLKWKK
jgi:3-hydroxyisobutyrate dehydrogenase